MGSRVRARRFLPRQPTFPAPRESQEHFIEHKSPDFVIWEPDPSARDPLGRVIGLVQTFFWPLVKAVALPLAGPASTRQGEPEVPVVAPVGFARASSPWAIGGGEELRTIRVDDEG